MSNNLDKQYTDLLKDIMTRGCNKSDRTGTGTISVFGRQLRHNMKDGFPLLTTKRMPFKTVAIELIWFLRGDTNIKFLLEHDCHIWDGDAFKNYVKHNQFNSNPKWLRPVLLENGYYGATLYTKEEFVEKILTDDEFANKWGDLGPIYGKQWRKWRYFAKANGGPNSTDYHGYKDQIKDLIHDLKNNPDSRRLIVNAWNVGELDDMVLPPCHFGFQCYTRELSLDERKIYHSDPSMFEDINATNWSSAMGLESLKDDDKLWLHSEFDKTNIPRRALSLMWSQRSVDTFLGLPFNIASYGLLLTLLGELVNMVPEELICNLGDTHLYLNHIEQAKEQIGVDLTFEEREAMYPNYMDVITPETVKCEEGMGQWYIEGATGWDQFRARISREKILTSLGVPNRTREPFELPNLIINTEFWLTESGECDGGPLNTDAFLDNLQDKNFYRCLLEDIQLVDYKAHKTIKAPLSN